MCVIKNGRKVSFVNRFFDVLLYIVLFVSIPLFVAELIQFPVWVGKIDVTKNKKGKPTERYLENKFALLEGRIVLTVILCVAISIISILFSSFPREIENPGFLLFIPLLVLFVGTGLGGIVLGQYFLNTARKNGIFKKINHFPTIFVRSRSQYGIGVIICFYLGCIVDFALMHLLFILHLI